MATMSTPALQLTFDPAPLGLPSPGPRASTGPVTILLAEDDDAFRDLLASALRDDGHVVLEARNGLELLDEIEACVRSPRRPPIGLIISDVRMPEFSGLDVLGAIRCAAWRTPGILITAFGSPETHAEAEEMGALLTLDKPFDLDVLRAAVQEVLTGR